MAKKRKRERERERETSSRGASWNTSEKSNFVETNFRIIESIRKIWLVERVGSMRKIIGERVTM